VPQLLARKGRTFSLHRFARVQERLIGVSVSSVVEQLPAVTGLAVEQEGRLCRLVRHLRRFRRDSGTIRIALLWLASVRVGPASRARLSIVWRGADSACSHRRSLGGAA